MAKRSVAPTSNNVSTLIDSTTALLNNATYTSDTIRIGNFARVTGIIMSDQSGTLTINQSADGTNFDYSTSVSITGNTGAAFSVEVVAEWVQISFVTAGSQSTMRLYTYGRAV